MFNILKLYSENITGERKAGFSNGSSKIYELYTADSYYVYIKFRTLNWLVTLSECIMLDKRQKY